MNVYFAQESPELFKTVKGIIEDILKNANVMSCSVETVINGTTKIDSSCLLMVDLDLPGKNTLELLAYVKDKTQAPIVVMDHMNNGPGRMIKAISLGASDYVFKPIHDSRLISTVLTRLRSVTHVLEN